MRKSCGNRTQKNHAVSVTAAIYGQSVTGALRGEWGVLKHAAKLLGRAVGVGPRTAENWLAGKSAPRGAELIRLLANSASVRSAFAALLEQAWNESAAAERQSADLEARNAVLVAAVHARASPAMPKDRQLVAPPSGRSPKRNGTFVVAPTYVGPCRRGS
jgi:hypothetical protein